MMEKVEFEPSKFEWNKFNNFPCSVFEFIIVFFVQLHVFSIIIISLEIGSSAFDSRKVISSLKLLVAQKRLSIKLGKLVGK